MEYYVTEATKIEGKETATAVTTKDDEMLARMVYHQALASAYANDKLESVTCDILNEFGGHVLTESWHKPAPEPTPEPNAES